MCGIAGLRAYGDAVVDFGLARRMSETLTHRGPDERGEWLTSTVALMHRRLSIIDLAGSPQPMATPDGRFHLTFNGEILNYRQVRAELDYPFVTDGDTEVVLAAFALGGVEGVKRLRGQFAFAVYDCSREELTLVRDRLGILPLFYSEGDGLVAFGSEIKAVVPALPSGARLAEGALHSYLRRRAVPAPGTFVDGVQKVRPAQVVRFDRSGRKSTTTYWSPPPPQEVRKVSVNEAVDLVDRALGAAVDEALVADVPVGSYLSGGVDSSLVVALASARTSHPIHTFCASFDDPDLDESPHAQAVAEIFGTRHHAVPATPGAFQDLWPRLSRHRDAPISEPADIVVFQLAEAARQHVKVVLSGEGSDEIFGGYPKYRFARATTIAGLLPGAVRRPALDLVQRALPHDSFRARIALRSLMPDSATERALGWFAPFTTGETERLLGASDPRTPIDVEYRDPVDLMTRLDLTSWLPDNLLERGDRMSMAASLELRPPFLDHRLVELGVRLPSRLKVHGGETKWILKQVADRYLPTSITRRPKMGFKVPLRAWFRAELRDLARDLLLSQDSRLGGVLDQGAVRELLTSHDSGRRNEEIRIWTLLSLEQWARSCLDDG